MKVLYATDHTSYLVRGKVYLSSRIFPILQRYATVFEKIVLYSRFVEIDEAPEDTKIGEFIDDYIIENKLIHGLVKCDDEIITIIQNCNLVIGRVPSFLAYKVLDYSIKNGIPSFAEIMGCPWDSFWNHGLKGKLIAPYMFLKMRNIVANVDYASYVTEKFLQKRYPCNKSYLSASNVLLKVNEDALNMRFKHVESLKKHTFNLMTTAAVDVRYKGQEYVIKAIPHLKNKGINITYYIVGDGDQSYLKSIASKYGVEKNIVFTGRKRIDDVFRLLDDVDIYIQPSLQEGLPRSVIEAMSRGCIVIGARTAGIPELIDDKYVVRKKSVSDIYKLIYEIDAYDKKTIMQIAKRNIEKSKEFEEEVLNKRRYKYYQDVRNNIEK